MRAGSQIKTYGWRTDVLAVMACLLQPLVGLCDAVDVTVAVPLNRQWLDQIREPWQMEKGLQWSGDCAWIESLSR